MSTPTPTEEYQEMKKEDKDLSEAPASPGASEEEAVGAGEAVDADGSMSVDDDEEDEIRSRKRRRRNQFIDMEAEVDDDDDEEEEDDSEAEVFREQFIEDPAEVAGPEVQREHREVDRRRQKIEDADAERLAAKFRERYGRSAAGAFQGGDQVSQRLLLPSVDDPSIWALRCRQGKERELVRQILQKKQTLKSLEIYLAFQRDNFVGYIYIEARKPEAVEQAVKGLTGIFGAAQSKFLVPVDEFPALLRQNKSTDVALAVGLYVRVRRGLYKGDLAVVTNLSESGLEVQCRVVPRVTYGAGEGRAGTKFRAEPRLFSEREAERAEPERLRALGARRYLFRNEEYVDGFLHKDFKLQLLDTALVAPTLEELTRLNGADGGIDLAQVAGSVRQAAQSAMAFHPGDLVEVIRGEQASVRGRVLAAAHADIVTVVVTSAEPRLNGARLEFPAASLRKLFSPGDHVRVVAGRHANATGLVVSVAENHVTLLLDQTRADITVFANSLVRSGAAAAAAAPSSAFDLLDLVQLNAASFGVVIRADRDVYAVLAQDDRVATAAPSALQKLVLAPHQRLATDRNGLEVCVGDTVRELGGQRREGAVLHIHRAVLFIKSKTELAHLGVFAAPAAGVATVAAKGSISGPDLNKMNPNVQLANRPPPLPAAGTGGRDRTLNQNVSIISGPYKGNKGIVKDANGNTARVEFHSRTKIVTISKDRLGFYDEHKNLISYQEFIGGRGGRAGTGAGTGAGSGTPAWQSGGPAAFSGSRTPAWQSGGQTAYGGQTPSWSSTAKPAAGSGSTWGGGSTWGNKSSYGGGSTWGNKSSYGGGSTWGDGNKSAYGGKSAYERGDGNKSAYGSKSAYDGGDGNKSAYGGGSAWGRAPEVAPTPGDWAAPTPGPAPTPGAFNEYDDGYEPNADTP